MVLVVALGALAGERGARAQPADARDSARRAVGVVVAADDADDAAVEASLRELLGRIGLDARVSRAERLDVDDAASLAVTPRGALATAWIDLRPATHASVVLVDGASGRVVARRTVARGASPAVAIEELAHIVYASVEELASPPATPAPAPPAPAPAPAPAPPAPPAPAPSPPSPAPPATATRAREPAESGWALDAAGFFAGRGFGPGEAAVLGGGGALGVAAGRGAWRPAVWLSASYHVAFDASGPLVDVHTKALALRLAPTLRLAGGARWMLEAGPEAGVDVLWASPRAVGIPAARLEPDATNASVMAGALVAAHLAVGASADLFLAASCDVDMAPPRYLVRESAGSDVVFQTWRVRPALALGFTFTVAGAASYAAREEAR